MKLLPQSDFAEVISLIQGARFRALTAVNTELINLYWSLGEYISRKVEKEGWGKAVVQGLAEYIREHEPGSKGFSAQNLWRMKQFYDTYRDNEKLSALLRELPWTHNLIILSKSKNVEEREFYLRLAIRERFSSRELERQMDAAVFERTMLAPAKLSPAARQLYPTAPQVFKDSYVLDFLDLPEGHSEEDLQKGLVANLKRFLIELGRDFCFVGEQFQL